MSKFRNFWTEEELKVLERDYGTVRVADLASVLGRSEGSIRRKANNIGLSSGLKASCWSQADIETLKRMRGHGASYEAIGKLMGRSREAVTVQARRLGLGRAFLCRKPEPRPKPEPEDRAEAKPEMPPHPFWTVERDTQVIRTGGSYEALAAVSEALGKPTTYVQARWHKLKMCTV